MTKILMILYQTLGDCVLGNTLIEELKKNDPDCEIVVAVYPNYSEIFDTNPHVKSLLITKDHDITLREICSGKYDKILVPAQLTHTDTLWHHVPKYMDGHLVDYYAGRCGLKITNRREYMYPSENDTKAVMEHIRPGKLTIILHTTSLVPAKNWGYFSDLVPKLSGTNLIQIGGQADERVAGTKDLRAQLTYNQIAALCAQVNLFVGVDSGLAYISSAMGCPTIAIMGMSTAKTSGPIGKNTHFIEPERPKGCEWPCHTNCKQGEGCIKTIKVETVLTKIKEVMENGKAEKEG